MATVTTPNSAQFGTANPEAWPAGRAARGAARVSRTAIALGALGLACALFAISRLLERWRFTGPPSHEATFLGLHVSYPAANAGAVVVLVLALVGLAVTARAIVAATRELSASRRFTGLVRSRGIERLGDALVFDDDRPHAFCAGLFRPRVYISSGAVASLDGPALTAVLRHEHHHVQRRDPLRVAIGRVIAHSLFVVPGLEELMRQQQTLAELGADESAIGAAGGSRSALARALLAFADGAHAEHAVGIDAARVDHLMGEAPAWRFPMLLSVIALSVLVLVIAVAVLAGQVASGSATLAPPFLSSRPCVVVLALIPSGLGSIALRLALRVS
jgi:Zn-dependent protease with chaperone function